MTRQVAPDNEQQVLELVQWAAADGAALALQGKNTKQGFGAAVAADCVVSLEKLSGITEYHPDELVMTALPGTPLAEVQQALEKHGQQLAFEPPALNRMYQAADAGTIGGVFAGNLAGPRRFKAGGARDHLLEVTAVNGRGEAWKSGGKVIKNVSGYDLPKLMAGSWGTLSVLTGMTFKVLPAPAASLSLAAWGLSVEQGMALLTDIASSPCEASGLAFLPGAALAAIEQDEMTFADESMTLIRLEGSRLSLNERLQALKKRLPPACRSSALDQAASETAWRWVRDAAPLHDVRRTPGIVRVSMPPTAAAGLARFLDQLGGCAWCLDAAGGWLWAGLCRAATEEKLGALRREAHAVGGNAVLYRASDAVKRRAGVYSFPAAALQQVNERIKAGFDPSNLFNPGRLPAMVQGLAHAH